MSFKITITIGPTVSVEVAGADADEVLPYWEAMGGSSTWLTEQIHDIVKATEQGVGVASLAIGLGAKVIQSEENPTTPAASGGATGKTVARYARTAGAAGRNGKSTEDVPLPDDPAMGDDSDAENWGADADAEVDPWDEPERPTKPAPERRSSPNRAQRDQGDGVKKDKWGRLWTLNLPEAPDCYCGETAAKVSGKSKSGNRYTVYKCAKDAPGGNYQDKCDFSEFPD